MCPQDGMKRFSSVHVRQAGSRPIMLKLQHIKEAYDSFSPNRKPSHHTTFLTDTFQIFRDHTLYVPVVSTHRSHHNYSQ